MIRRRNTSRRPTAARTRAGSALIGLLLLSACSSSTVRQPEVTLDGVQLGGLGLRGGTLLVNMRVYNPNRFALNANELRYDLAISQDAVGSDTNWVDFASGTYDRSFSVAGRDTAHVQIPVEFSYSGFGSAASSILRSGTFTYRANGEVDVRTPLGTFAVPFNRRGTVTMAGVR
jgi:LEA14-like dessication related protein